MAVKVKICGNTSYEDAALALDLGADAVGFVFYDKSTRHIAPATAREIAKKLPPFAVKVGVFVNEFDIEVVRSISQMCGLNVIQLHGGESPEYCARLSDWTVVKALRVNDSFDPSHVGHFTSISAVLLDAYDADTYGGTGRLFDWSKAVAAKQYARSIILAGGLNPENVALAIKMVKPYGVDVCSGVECKPGQKDKLLLRSFMNEVERTRSEVGHTGALSAAMQEWFEV
jgi:phosphoribosylanthranilate isomerase